MLVPLILTPFVSRSRISIPAFDSFSISPLYTNKDSTILVTTRRSYLEFYLFIQNDKNMNVAVLSGKITEPGTYNYTYNNSYTRNQNKVFVRYTIDGSTYSDTPHIERNVLRPSYRNLTGDSPITSNGTVAVIYGDMSYTTRNIRHDFTNFVGYYVPNYYHKINLSDFKINVSSQDKPFFKCTPKLSITNYGGAFNDLFGNVDIASFDLKLVETQEGFTFALANDYYVNTLTLKMVKNSSVLYCAKTNHIFFPRNSMQNQDKYGCYFTLNNFGIDNDLVIHQFDVLANRDMIGDCINSKYCVIRQ